MSRVRSRATASASRRPLSHGESVGSLPLSSFTLCPGVRTLEVVAAGLVGAVRAVAAARRPLLGICLGHQALGLAFGARLIRSAPVHGKVSTVHFAPSRLFPGIAGPEPVMRYHSLALADVAPPLRVVAATDDGLPMAIEHESLPMAGLQFHPDSYATPHGREMIAAFFEAAR